MKRFNLIGLAVSALLLSAPSCKPDHPGNTGKLQLVRVTAGDKTLNLNGLTEEIAANADLVAEFSSAMDSMTATEGIVLKSMAGNEIGLHTSFSADLTRITLSPDMQLEDLTIYNLEIGQSVKGLNGETFAGLILQFKTAQGAMTLLNLTLNGAPFVNPKPPVDVDYRQAMLNAEFTDPLDPDSYLSFFNLSGGIPITGSLSADGKSVAISTQSPLKGYSRYYFVISSNLTSRTGKTFQGYSNSFYTALDSTDKFPRIPDEQLLESVQRQTFRYFWEFAHPDCGLARERNTSGNVVTIGGSGFGVMTIMVGIERGWINRMEGLDRLGKILSFLESCDRFHGAWPHWLDGSTGKTIPFSTRDNGGDLVETSFMIQGLLTFREYLDPSSEIEKSLAQRINALWESVEWDWYTKGEDVLYWHWSPDFQFNMNHQIRGYNETLITYVLAASAPVHSVAASAYHKGYAVNGSIRNGRKYYDIVLPLGPEYGGPLFFTHYSFLGLDPRNLRDTYADYWIQNVNQSRINFKHCMANPRGYVGYSSDCWGLTASDNQSGYSAHSPTNDIGVISPTAAISSLPYTPEESMKAIRHFYYKLGDKLWGTYGFYDAFNVTQGWWADSFLAIDQGPVVLMLENYRTGLLWKYFMQSPEIRSGLTKLGFTF